MKKTNTEPQISDHTKIRNRKIIYTSIINIVTNVLLSGFKASVGVLTGSIAIVIDAVNNLTDAASSVITIIGTKLAERQPDKRHPFGYGRIEYLTAMIISIIILNAGIVSVKESLEKIITPVRPSYSAASLIIVAAAAAAKFGLFKYLKNAGERVNCDSLANCAKEAMFDVVRSISTLAAALFFIMTKISIEAWLGMVMSVLFIKTGVEMIQKTISQLLGEETDSELIQRINNTISAFEPVRGTCGLILNNYGPENYMGSLYIKVPETVSAGELDELLRKITNKVLEEHNVILSAIGVYSVHVQNN